MNTDFLHLYDGNYANVDTIRSVYANGATTTWWIEADIGGNSVRLAGPEFSSQADAQRVIKQLVAGRSAEDFIN